MIAYHFIETVNWKTHAVHILHSIQEFSYWLVCPLWQNDVDGSISDRIETAEEALLYVVYSLALRSRLLRFQFVNYFVQSALVMLLRYLVHETVAELVQI